MPTDFLFIIDILGTFAFAVSGAFLAMQKKLDPFGVIVLSFVTAIGGGTLRDMMIGNLPVTWLRNDTVTYVITIAAVITLLFGRYLRHLNTTLFLFDALGLGLFTIIGIELAIAKDFSAGICIALGTVTACFGGVIRDVLLNEVPLLFRKDIYALACVAGGVVYFICHYFNLPTGITELVAASTIIFIRIIALKFHIHLPILGSTTKENSKENQL